MELTCHYIIIYLPFKIRFPFHNLNINDTAFPFQKSISISYFLLSLTNYIYFIFPSSPKVANKINKKQNHFLTLKALLFNAYFSFR